MGVELHRGRFSSPVGGFSVQRYKKWTALLVPGEQGKSIVKRLWLNLSEFLIKKRM